MNRFLFATILGAVCAALATAADPALREDIGSSPALEQAGDLPPGVYLTGDEEPITESKENALTEGNDDQELFGGPGRFRRGRFCYRRGPFTQCGWRYPWGFWSRRGRFVYGRSCGFGRSFGGFYYC